MGINLHWVSHDSTIFVSELTQDVTEEILWELFMQVGPVESVSIPRDRERDIKNGYAFIEMATEEDAQYAAMIMDGIYLFSAPMKVVKGNQVNNEDEESPAKLYIRGLAPSITDMELQAFFRQFGNVQNAKVVIDPTTGLSRGHGFVTYSKFEESDAAINNANGQYFGGQVISISYAYKDGTKSGEQHGDVSERLITPNAQVVQAQKNSQLQALAKLNL